MQRRRVMLAAGKKPRLPREYQKVEWLKGQSFYLGRNYIDTNYYPNSNTKFELSCDLMRATRYSRYFGCGNTNGNPLYYWLLWKTTETNSYSWAFAYNTNTGGTNLSGSFPSGPSIFELDNSRLKINGVVLLSFYSIYWQSDTSLYLFSSNDTRSDRDCDGYVYYAKIWENNVLIRDFIPCYRKTDNKPGLYDLCGSICPLTNSPFYINSGTGEFLVGPDVN